MRIWISSLAAALVALPAIGGVVTRLAPSHDKLVALTFDACERGKPAQFDTAIGDFLTDNKIPFTIFVTGRFARHNQAVLRRLAGLDFVEIENHSLDHDNHMDQLGDAEIRRQIGENDQLLASITGRHTHYFRFPAGNADAHAVGLAEAMGYKVVHWSFASGDPAKTLTPEHLSESVVASTKPGSILIFHINGRGYSTAAALPGIVETLKSRGYRFVTVAEGLR